MQRTWGGGNVVGETGFGLLTTLLIVPGVVVFFASGFLFGVSVAAAFLVMASAVVWLLVTAAVVTAVSGICRTAFYRLAVDGRALAAFADANLSRPFRGV
ncbi:hypothetical protein [Nocardia sp. NBC_01009]|uniref:hypothetical protein n=1 Tax=Nocardia sp. NBC_01009 TaxID=2975996 RepID=UPI00386AA9C3|nr:hypothetical protein OHA42_11175 [Nocardia sp. NBC_01009]